MGFNWGHDLMGVLALAVVGVILRELVISKGRGDSESTSRTNDGSGEENEALRRDSESTSRTDNLVGEEYDVFLSFRGSDTRLKFTDHLYNSMVQAGIHVFLDSEELESGKEIKEVLKAVNESRIYIPIFSPEYASSVWCLREVERMVDCHSKSKGKKDIIPIFYEVTADDVKLKTNRYKKAIRKHKRNFLSLFGLNHGGRFDSCEVQQWEIALKTVGKMKGRELQGQREAEQIKSIVDEVSRMIGTRHVINTENLVEDNAQVEGIMKLLDVGSNGVRFIGIHGTGGVGKTSLAKIIFKKLYFQFENRCFLEDVRASSQSHDGILKLQKKLLSSLAGSRIADQVNNVGGGITMIQKVFRKKEVLIVLDDLDEQEQLQNLAGKSEWFDSGSIIIITTREASILNTQVDQTKKILAYEVGLNLGLALRLFYKNAFRSDFAVKEYEESASKIVHSVGNLPLAVVVIGSHLFNFGNHLRNSEKRKVWDETLEKLGDGGIFDIVRKTLMISYERLNNTEKEVFLDIACFFTNEDSTYPVIMWEDCKYFPHSAMAVLSQRSLIKIRDDDSFWMHDQVRDFGRDIVIQEYSNKIRRVWTREKALELLEEKKTNTDVIALSLMFDGHGFTREELAHLPNLRFFRGKESDFSGDFKNLLPKLKWLSWETRQTTFHASNFHFSKLLVLDLSGSNIEDGWSGWSQMKMDKLKVLDLTDCISLKVTPDLSNFTSLEKLILARCVKLTTIDGSIGKLTLLRTLNIKGCWFLQKLPIEIGSLKCLTEIIMPQNFQPFKLPDTFGNLESLSSFILDHHPRISQLPNSIGRLVKVTRLSLRGCVGIRKLPSSIGEMEMLAELDLSKSGIVELPDSIGYLKKLRVITASYTALEKFPHTIGQVEMLEELHAKKCYDLTDENLDKIGLLSYLRILDLSYTRVSRFPMALGSLSHLQTLEMSLSHPQEVPDLPSSLTHLHMQARHFPTTLDLSSLVWLDHVKKYRLTISTEEPGQTWTNNLPEVKLIHPLPSNLSTIKFRGISLLPSFSNIKNLSVLCVIEYQMPHFSISQELINLTELKLSKCKLLVEIPGLSLLKNLQRLDLERLESLVEIPGLSELESLLYFRISCCDRIESLPNFSKLDKLQHIELNACLKIRDIEGVKGLESLELDNRRCTILKRLLDVSRPTWLSHKVPIYDVFLNFKGADTRLGFMRFLYNELAKCQVRVFEDDGKLRHSQDLGRELSQVLDDCHIYISILSCNYASSKQCLRELAHIVKCTSMSNGSKIIIPIFYDVEIDDVNLESNLYRRELYKHEMITGNEVEEWKMALRKVARIKGINIAHSRNEVEVVRSVAREVLSHLMEVNAEFD